LLLQTRGEPGSSKNEAEIEARVMSISVSPFPPSLFSFFPFSLGRLHGCGTGLPARNAAGDEDQKEVPKREGGRFCSSPPSSPFLFFFFFFFTSASLTSPSSRQTTHGRIYRVHTPKGCFCDPAPLFFSFFFFFLPSSRRAAKDRDLPPWTQKKRRALGRGGLAHPQPVLPLFFSFFFFLVPFHLIAPSRATVRSRGSPL